jgi:hypothetical protein
MMPTVAMSRGQRWVIVVIVLGGWLSAAPSASADQRRHDYPWITFSPAAAPVGSVVHFHGTLPPSLSTGTGIGDKYNWGLQGTVSVPGKRYCGLVVYISHQRIKLDYRAHRVSGSFVIGRRGACVQTDIGNTPVVPGVYGLMMGCHDCVLGELRITAGALPFTGLPALPLILAGVIALLMGCGLHFAGARRRSL